MRHKPVQFSPRRQRGVALFIGLVFLIVLSLVAVIAMQSTLLEMRMSTNVARHEEAFQVSETTRSLVGPFIDQSMFNSGWPTAWDGSDTHFDFSTICPNAAVPVSEDDCAPVKMFHAALGTSTKLLYGALDAGEVTTDPSTWLTDLTFGFADPTSLQSNLSFVPDGTVLRQGAGAAQAGGYRGLGTGAAAGGSARIVQIQSVGTSPADGTNGRADTISQYEAVVQ
jgi:type IV pilus assembly PilX-like protein